MNGVVKKAASWIDKVRWSKLLLRQHSTQTSDTVAHAPRPEARRQVDGLTALSAPPVDYLGI